MEGNINRCQKDEAGALITNPPVCSPGTINMTSGVLEISQTGRRHTFLFSGPCHIGRDENGSSFSLLAVSA